MHHTIRKNFFMISAMILGMALLSSCGKTEQTQMTERAFRVELTQELSLEEAEAVVCGKDCAWVLTTAKNKPIYQRFYGTDDLIGVAELAWQQSEQENLVNLTERDGTLYAQIQNIEEESAEIRKYTGWWQTVLTIEETNPEWNYVGNGMFVDEAETVYLFGGNSVTHIAEDGQADCVYELTGTPCFLQENEEGQLECVTADMQNIRCYLLKDGKAEQKWQTKDVARRVYKIQSNEAGVLCVATEEALLFLDEQTGAVIAETEDVKLGVSGVQAGIYDAGENTLRLYGQTGEFGRKLYEAKLSGTDASDEMRTELVYATFGSVNERVAPDIQAAILEFNQKNENYYITVKNYFGDYEYEQIHADMAAGTAPDIIDMSVPTWYESDVSNGYLEDLTPYLKALPYCDDLMWNVLNTYEIDGGIYLLPPQFIMSGVVLRPEDEAEITEWNMQAFEKLVEKNQWEKLIMQSGVTGDPEALLETLLTARQEEFIDWENQTVSFESEEFEALLTLCKKYAENQKQDTSDWVYEEFEAQTLCNTWNWHTYIDYMWRTVNYGRDYHVHGYPTASGEMYTVSVCLNCCAIYAGSDKKEGAWEFLKLLLEDTYQKRTTGFNVGFPIRKSMLKELAEEAQETEITINNTNTHITESELQIINEVLNQQKVVRDYVNQELLKIIEEEAQAYFYGDRGASETAHAIQNRAWIVMAE